MIEELLTWLHLTNLSALQNLLVAQSQSNLIFIAYIVTIRKSYLFGAAFLLCDITSMIGIIPESLPQPIYGLSFYCIALISWLSIAGIHIRLSNNKNTLLCCAIMILYLLLMAWDSYVNAYNQTFIWVHYEAIILCIHVSLIVSLYNNRLIIDGLVGKLNGLLSILRPNVYLTYFCYTVRKTNQGK
tara:strand:+ start:42407 stop:42964 length:558 start_codon:yes stop_codon:yes gene_type:complete